MVSQQMSMQASRLRTGHGKGGVMDTARIEFAPVMDEATRQFIVNAVDYHSIATTGLSDWFPVNFVLRGERGDILGGLLGDLWGSWLRVTYLWVSEAARGAGHGTRLMQQAEDYARARGAAGATLETFSFQARPFYERLGYEVFATLDGFPPHRAKFFLRKALRVDPVGAVAIDDSPRLRGPGARRWMTDDGRWQRADSPHALMRLGAVRFARRYYLFQEAVAFYRDLVGLRLNEMFDHSYGSNGAIFALPDSTMTFEIVQSTVPVHIGTHEQLCLYFWDEGAMAAVRDRLARAGVPALRVEPYWQAVGAVCFRDPEGRELVLAPFVYGKNEPDAGASMGRHDISKPA
jgi:GNAT superfamily N-acetyltransferase/catechol 2,3-dioxygenase-like lactoylglutathione lyase family enzyme